MRSIYITDAEIKGKFLFSAEVECSNLYIVYIEMLTEYFKHVKKLCLVWSYLLNKETTSDQSNVLQFSKLSVTVLL